MTGCQPHLETLGAKYLGRKISAIKEIASSPRSLGGQNEFCRSGNSSTQTRNNPPTSAQAKRESKVREMIELSRKFAFIRPSTKKPRKQLEYIKIKKKKNIPNAD